MKKNARHCFRLLHQGRELLETGQLTVRVSDPEQYWAFDDMGVDEIVLKFTREDILVRATPSCLPDKPDYDKVERTLHQLRWDFL